MSRQPRSKELHSGPDHLTMVEAIEADLAVN
jgi:hypothetical protein